VVVKVTLAIGSTSGIAALLYLLFAGHVPFSSQAGVFEDAMAVIVLVAVATTVLTLPIDRIARSRLRYQAGRRAVETAESNEQALQTFQALHKSLSWRWRRWLGLPGDHEDEDEDPRDGEEGERKED
jgi:hypothetical protein